MDTGQLAVRQKKFHSRITITKIASQIMSFPSTRELPPWLFGACSAW